MSDANWAKVRFYSDASGQADKIRELLLVAGISFLEVPSSGRDVPALQFAGTRYHTLDTILTVVNDLAVNRDALVEKYGWSAADRRPVRA
ncbi:MAG: hypothetical protein ACRD1R_10865 [Acidobacteriota bacterium]